MDLAYSDYFFFFFFYILGVFAMVVLLVTLNKEGLILAVISHVNSTQYSHIAGY